VQFVELTRPPTTREIAAAIGAQPGDVRAAYQRLAQGKAIVLRPGTDELLMAHPLSAVPTRYRVYVGDRAYSPNCGWDALGVAAMLDADARVEGTCGDCDEPLALEVRDGSIRAEPLRVHFAVPPRLWWEDILFT
jgi:Alkylmercury lyase